jgi:hypothetical protein
VLDDLGFFDKDFSLAADVDFLMRALEIKRYSSVYIPQVLVLMSLGGATNRSVANVWRQNQEVIRALQRHGLYRGILPFVVGKLRYRGQQFLRRTPMAVAS